LSLSLSLAAREGIPAGCFSHCILIKQGFVKLIPQSLPMSQHNKAEKIHLMNADSTFKELVYIFSGERSQPQSMFVFMQAQKNKF